MSALRQSAICGLEGPEFPYRGEACQGHRGAGQSPPKRVVSYGGGLPWRLVPKSGFAFLANDRDRDQHQGSRDKA